MPLSPTRGMTSHSFHYISFYGQQIPIGIPIRQKNILKASPHYYPSSGAYSALPIYALALHNETTFSRLP